MEGPVETTLFVRMQSHKLCPLTGFYDELCAFLSFTFLQFGCTGTEMPILLEQVHKALVIRTSQTNTQDTLRPRQPGATA